jgi:putative membrane protein
VVVITGIIETVGAKTGFPFGSYYYTGNFGPRIAGILPVTTPLAWLVIVTSLTLIFRQAWPQARRVVTAAAVATGATLLDVIMEPFATQIKMYWLWEGGVIPLQNYLAWWVVTFGLVMALLPPREQLIIGRDWCPHFILGGILLLFLVTRVSGGI